MKLFTSVVEILTVAHAFSCCCLYIL